MFTGIVAGCGVLRRISPEGPNLRLEIEPPEALRHSATHRPPALGDSVAVNGCCLTIVDIADTSWSFQAGQETLSKTNLGHLRSGDHVNLELPLTIGTPLGGHFVQGHVDGTATIDRLDRDGDWTTAWFRLPPTLARYLVPKGSVAVDGISLTVVNAESDRFSVALIPHTLEATTLGRKHPGDLVNIEVDLLAKYVEKLLHSSSAE